MAIVTLTTDFGTADGYVGAMKGVLATRSPAARVVDITHQVPRHDVAHAAYVLAQVAPHFPVGTVHVVVVDPGVGTERRAVVVEARGQVFVGPDNGVFDLAVPADCPVFAIESGDFRAQQVSRTFHGRDVFAPAAAAIAAGARPADAGPPLEPRRGGGAGSERRVVHVDEFGNLITNLEPDEGARGFQLAGHRFGQLRGTFGDVAEGELVAYVGSAGTVEVAVNGGSAAERLGVRRGAVVVTVG